MPILRSCRGLTIISFAASTAPARPPSTSSYLTSSAAIIRRTRRRLQQEELAAHQREHHHHRLRGDLIAMLLLGGQDETADPLDHPAYVGIGDVREFAAQVVDVRAYSGDLGRVVYDRLRHLSLVELGDVRPSVSISPRWPPFQLSSWRLLL